MATKDITLWSFLTQSSAKQEIFCSDELRVSIEEFAQELIARLKANKLPATAELVTVNWDDTNRTQPLILVRYTGTQVTTDVLQYAVGLEQLGNFAYLEKKTYLFPPKLPKITNLQKPKKSSDHDYTVLLLLFGIVCLIFTIGFSFFAFGLQWHGMQILLPLLIVLIALLSTTVFIYRAIKGIIRIRKETLNKEIWNRTKEQTDIRLAQIMARWQEETLELAYVAQTTDEFGRWTSAISTTIDQVVQKLFIDRDAQTKQWQEEQKSQDEIEKELERRNAELFG